MISTRALATLAIAALPLACGGAPQAIPPTSAQRHPLHPAADLRRWLDGLPGGRQIRLPVEIHWDTDGLGGVKAAYINRAGPDALAVRLDTGALGLTLADQLQDRCAAWPCRVLLTGRWGPLVGPKRDDAPTFAIFSVGEVIAPDAGPTQAVVVDR